MVDLHADRGEHERNPWGGNTGAKNHDDGRGHRAGAPEDQGDSGHLLG